uniref:NADH-ubiquinone oxidoreductase chain 4 n=1 Tax=Malawimonas californiana TaxID=221722 RepID=A0A0B5GSD1_MALCL|nr:NADH dehydrogenase subunit 4 [Malawimonas californiana]AJF22855.1 NADH dehydrogenase subunit 4 [Malawimonas californiana]
MFIDNILLLTIIFPLFGIIILLITNNENLQIIRLTSLTVSLVTFILSIFLWVLFDNTTSKFQFITKFELIPYSNINFSIGIDGISIFFIILTTFLIPLCLLSSWNSIKIYVKEYMILFLLLESLILNLFSAVDLIFFYIFFESVLIPMFLIIGIWGARERKIHAAFQFFLYTLLGSLLMLLAILIIYYNVGTTDLNTLLITEFSKNTQLILWIAFFASFAVKVPMVPVHIWLPEAHVEAPTAGSVILAGILLKLGTYGFLRFSLSMFPDANYYYMPLIFSMSVIAIVYTSLTTLRQIDLKKIIAYSSVAHMNFVTIGLFTLNVEAIEGSILLMLSHGFISSALFLCIGILYDRHHTRIVKYYSGITLTMPIFSLLFLFFTLSNISLPGTSSFIGEFLILLSTFQTNSSICFIASLGIILGAGYAMWLYNRVAFGNINVNYINPFNDINYREFMIFIPLVIMILLMGIYPNIFLDYIHLSVYNLLSIY